MITFHLLLCVLTITSFIPLNDAQFFGYEGFPGSQSPSFTQYQQVAKGRRPYEQFEFGRGPQNQISRNPGNRPRQTSPQQGQVPWTEVSQQNGNRQQGQVPWVETTGNQQQQGQVPWVEATGNRQQQGQVPWVEATGNRQQQGQIPWSEVNNSNQQSGSSTQRPITTSTSRPCSCTSTSEYNPVCASNNQTYSNPGRLQCAVQCNRRNRLPTLELIHYGVCRTPPADLNG